MATLSHNNSLARSENFSRPSCQPVDGRLFVAIRRAFLSLFAKRCAAKYVQNGRGGKDASEFKL
ncbi:MAG: hypothetical protein A2505_06630 [Deltaproteobacteria bacterium RIFOXYD12_FULL_55_16]|nr:MAG: hypothetical protein A2505_06630 [Deltaproteobacteria bacterium RIFOXYD12_FULL_55_16]